ncbi:MAG: SAM-dependent methyltransferase [Actinobacteria bacterium]|nr:SAM-dependent methyltransferase [Actinomycetota bacterium]
MTSPTAGGDVAPVAGSFRDPAGFVFTRDGGVYRHVARSFADDYDLLGSSGLYDALIDAGLLIPHVEVEAGLSPHPADAHRVLRPEQVATISHPYEWCPGQLRDAALATLRAQEVALDHGMSLRDASAYNIQFHRGRPVLIDTLSFERLPEGRPWVAYRQFCEHFLAPLALMVHVDVRLGRLQRTDVSGVPVDLASTLLPLRTRFRPSLLTHLHLQARAQRSRAGDGGSGTRESNMSMQALRGLIDSLRGAVDKLRWEPDRSTWSDYYAQADHYTDEAMQAKERVVASMLDAAGPSTVWDLGANTGRFSRIAADRGALVVAFDQDEAAVELHWQAVRDSDTEVVLPLMLDLANPSPAVGWANQERSSLAQRGPVDAVLALALVHHLAIGNNVPLDRVAAFMAELGRDLIVEWVPKDDPRVRQLLATREDIFEDYDHETFTRAFERHFEAVSDEPLPGSDRIVHHYRRR